MPLESLLGPVVTSWIAHIVAGFTAFAFLYGAAKILWTRLSGRPFPANAVTRKLDAFVELGTNVLGFINKLRAPSGAPLIPNPEVQRRDAMIAEMAATLDAMQRRLNGALAVPARTTAEALSAAVAALPSRPLDVTLPAPSAPTSAEGVPVFDPEAHITRAELPADLVRKEPAR